MNLPTEIQELLDRFLAGTSTDAEERRLAEYAREHPADERLAALADMFAWFDAGMPALPPLPLSADEPMSAASGEASAAAEKEVAAKEKKPAVRRSVWLRPAAWMASAAAAACIVLVVALGDKIAPTSGESQLAQSAGAVRLEEDSLPGYGARAEGAEAQTENGKTPADADAGVATSEVPVVAKSAAAAPRPARRSLLSDLEAEEAALLAQEREFQNLSAEERASEAQRLRDLLYMAAWERNYNSAQSAELQRLNELSDELPPSYGAEPRATQQSADAEGQIVYI